MIAYDRSNGDLPWVMRLGRKRNITIAALSLANAIVRYPRLWWQFRKIG